LENGHSRHKFKVVRLAAMPALAAAIGLKRRHQIAIAHAFRRWPNQLGAIKALKRLPNCRRREAKTPRERWMKQRAILSTIKSC
jgi:hypothetical protein